jgi:hypothetical protein
VAVGLTERQRVWYGGLQMMKTLEVPPNRTIVLPKRVFKPADRVVIFTEGSTVIVKRLEMSPLSSIAARVKDRPLPLRDIVREVHIYRQSKRAR